MSVGRKWTEGLAECAAVEIQWIWPRMLSIRLERGMHWTHFIQILLHFHVHYNSFRLRTFSPCCYGALWYTYIDVWTLFRCWRAKRTNGMNLHSHWSRKQYSEIYQQHHRQRRKCKREPKDNLQEEGHHSVVAIIASIYDFIWISHIHFIRVCAVDVGFVDFYFFVVVKYVGFFLSAHTTRTKTIYKTDGMYTHSLTWLNTKWQHYCYMQLVALGVT